MDIVPRRVKAFVLIVRVIYRPLLQRYLPEVQGVDIYDPDVQSGNIQYPPFLFANALRIRG